MTEPRVYETKLAASQTDETNLADAVMPVVLDRVESKPIQAYRDELIEVINQLDDYPFKFTPQGQIHRLDFETFTLCIECHPDGSDIAQPHVSVSAFRKEGGSEIPVDLAPVSGALCIWRDSRGREIREDVYAVSSGALVAVNLRVGEVYSFGALPESSV